jgi:hypothetical protein
MNAFCKTPSNYLRTYRLVTTASAARRLTGTRAFSTTHPWRSVALDSEEAKRDVTATAKRMFEFSSSCVIALNILSAQAAAAAIITQPDGISTIPMVRGDWVLFHPVYTPEELKAVEVRPKMAPSRW